MSVPPSAPLFSGPFSVRVRGEAATLIWTLVVLCAIIGGAQFLSYFVEHVFSWKEVALVIVLGMVYVSLGRGRLLGSSIRVHEQQFGHVYEIVAACAARLKMRAPQVFVRDDPFVPLVAVGIGEPYAIVISAQWVEHISPGELQFLVGRELAHISAGHTRITSLLSVNGRENAIIAIVFGAWLRRIEYTADRVGLLCCRSLITAFTAISVSAFHSVGRTIDLGAFADQQRELEADPSLRMGEWISATPYATNRIFALREFARDPHFLEWTARLDGGAIEWPGRADELLAGGKAARKMFAGPLRRLYAWIIDFALVNALLPAAAAQQARSHFIVVKPDAGDPAALVQLADVANHVLLPNDTNVSLFALLAYCVVLIGLSGQTCGMMILDLRVVSATYRKIGFGGAILRYLMQVVSYLIWPVGWFRFWGRVQPYEKWSRTRIIQGALLATQIERVSAPQLEAAAP
ncbi:MAG: hypothetical protein NVSMB64_14870 [Candidatus Velthaea sp.]